MFNESPPFPQKSNGRGSFDIIKSFDILPKIQEELNERSLIGATGSVLTTLLLLFIIYSEVITFMNPSIESVIVVDLERTEKLKIHLDLTFPRLPCSKLAVDVVDATGTHDHQTTHNIQKHKLDEGGKVLSSHRQTGLGKVDMSTYIPVGYCGSCYGAEDKPNQCCNSCSEVKRLFRKKARTVEEALKTEQCMRENPELTQEKEVGCQVIGYLLVPKVKGEFHIAAGSSQAEQHNDHSHHIHRFTHSELAEFNSSHTINHLSFGESFPGIIYPLNGVQRTHNGLEKSLYILEVVPSVFNKLNGDTIISNQFSVSEHHKVIPHGSLSHTLPGVFFKYDISAMKVQYSEKQEVEGGRMGWSQFIVRMCALCGGIFVVMGLLLRGIQMTLEAVLPAHYYKELSSLPLKLNPTRV